MFCEKCMDNFYCQAMSVGVCKICGKPTPSPHIPSYTICKNCADIYNLCEQCGVRLDEGELSHNI